MRDEKVEDEIATLKPEKGEQEASLPNSSLIPHPSSLSREPIASAPLSLILLVPPGVSEAPLPSPLPRERRAADVSPPGMGVSAEDRSSTFDLRFSDLILQWHTELLARGSPHEIIVVGAPGLRDEGGGMRDEYKTATPCISSLIPHPSSLIILERSGGIGACLRAGLAAAHYPLVAYCLLPALAEDRRSKIEDRSSNFELRPSDLAFRPSDLKGMLDVIDQVDLVSGYRVQAAPCGVRREAWGVRRLLSFIAPGPAADAGRLAARPRLAAAPHIRFPFKEYLYRWLVRLFFGVRLKDVDCPFKLFRRSIFERIPIQSDGEFVQAEILAKANFLGCLMTEVPVQAPQWSVEPQSWSVERAQPGTPASLRRTPHVSGLTPHASRPGWGPARWTEARILFRHPYFGPTHLHEAGGLSRGCPPA